MMILLKCDYIEGWQENYLLKGQCNGNQAVQPL